MDLFSDLKQASIEEVASLPTDSKLYRIVAYNDYLYFKDSSGYVKLNKGSLTSLIGVAPISVTGGTSPVVFISKADLSTDGYLDKDDFAIFNDKVTDVSGSSPVSVSGGTANKVVSMPRATTSVDGYLDNDDFNIFNNKVSDVVGFSPISATGGTTKNIFMPKATASVDGYLDNDDFAIFAAKLAPTGSGASLTDLTSSQIAVSQLGTPTYLTLKDFINTLHSSGRISGMTITGHVPANGTVDITPGTFAIKKTDAVNGEWDFADFAGQLGVTGADNSLNYLYLDYNGGTPTVKTTTNRTLIHDYDQFTLGRFYREGTDASDITSSGTNIYNFNRRVHNRLVKKYGFDYVSGSQLAEVGTRGLSVTDGVWYIGNTEINTAAHSTGSGYTFDSYYYNGAAWVHTTGVTQISNTQYNDTTSGLVSITTNRYVNAWIYMCPAGDIYWVYGQAQYTSLANAQATTSPASLPNYISSNTRLIARIVLRQGTTNFVSIDMVSVKPIMSGVATDHNNLAGLQGGASGDYYHLTNAERTIALTMTGHSIQDEGVPLPQRSRMNFVGAGVTVTDNAGGDVTIVTVSGGSGAGGHVIQDEGTPLTARANLNFVGDAVTVTDDSGNNATKVTINFNNSDSPIGSFISYAGITTPTNYLLADGSSVSRTTYADLWAVLKSTLGTCTISNASPAIVTLNGHGRATGDSIYFTTDGALPASLAASTIYYVIYINANTFNLATTYANAIAGTKINTSDAGSGTHTCVYAPWGIPAGSTTNFYLPDARAASIRGIGTSTVFTSNATIALGQIINDQLQDHAHGFNLANGGGSDNRLLIGSSRNTVTDNNQVGGLIASSGGTPRIGSETTGKAIGAGIYIKYTKQTVTAVGETFTNSIVAHAGGGQANAVELTSNTNVITTCATSLDSVKLYSSITTGYRQRVTNKGAKILALYPASGHSIESLSANTYIPVLPGCTVVLVATSTTAWELEIGIKQESKWVSITPSYVAGGGSLTTQYVNSAKFKIDTIEYVAGTIPMSILILLQIVTSSTARDYLTISIGNVVFKNLASGSQFIPGTGEQIKSFGAIAVSNTGNIRFECKDALAATSWGVSGEVFLESQTLI